MADLSSVTDNYFTVASETFTDNLSASIAALDTTVPVNNNSEYTNGDCVVLTVDPGTVNEATFIGKKSGLNFIECIWTEGNLAVGHSSGATIIDYDSATHHSAQSKGIQQFANDDGSLKTQPVRDALGLGATAVNGWEVLPNTLSVTTGYNKGQKEFDITVANADVTSTLSVGMKLRMERGTTAPTQCTDLEAGSSQYANDSSITGTIGSMTDDITCEAWAKTESYGTSARTIISKRSGSSGFQFRMEGNTGYLGILGLNAGTFEGYVSYNAIPLAVWTHLAATLDLSGSVSTIYMNGVSVPVQTLSGSGAISAFVQAGNLDLGASQSSTAATEFWDGKLSDVRVWGIVRTATQIRDNMNQQLVGSETNLVGYWKLNGDFNDSTSNANNLTAQGGAVATDVDNPMRNTEYAIITKIVFGSPNTTITVFTGNDHNIPNLTLSAPYYSVQKSPYGFPTDAGKWRLANRFRLQTLGTNSATFAAWASNGWGLTVPTGAWQVGYDLALFEPASGITSTYHISPTSVIGSATSAVDIRFSSRVAATAASNTFNNARRANPINITTAEVWTLYQAANGATTGGVDADDQMAEIFAECAYI